MNKIISPKVTALSFGILIVCFAIAFYAVAWQEPGSAPPSDNAPAPLNISATAQTKEGDLTINGVLKTLKDMIVNVVTIDGDGSVSTNLNSDKVDDYHAADLMAAGGGGTVFTRWGAATCPAGWTLLYSGKAYYIKSSEIIYDANNNTGGVGGIAGPVCSSGISASSDPWSPAENYYATFFATVCPTGYTCAARWIDCAVCYK